MSQTALFLATFTGDEEVDVVAIQSSVAMSSFLSYCENSGVSCMRTNERDAALLLKEQGGVGFGCYTTDGAINPDAVGVVRSIAAMRRKFRLSSIIGGIDLDYPVCLSAMKEEERQVA
jgi:hypothetical protein